jgi:hypothetical protein
MKHVDTTISGLKIGVVMRVLSRFDVNVAYREKAYTVKSYWLFFGQLVLIAISYFLFLFPHFSVDSYTSYSDTAMNHYLSLGRVINYVISHLLKLVQINPVRYQAFFIGLMMLIMALSATLLVKKFSSYFESISLKRFILINLCISISFVNIYLLEWYLFPEVSFIYGLGFFFSTLAVMRITEKVNVKNLLVCSFFLLLAENIYQINVTVFIIFSLAFILIQNLNSLTFCRFVKIVFPIGIVSVVTMMANVAIIKLLPFFGITHQSNKIMDLSISNLWARFVQIFTKEQANIWGQGSGFLGSWIMGMFLSASLIVLILVLFQNRRKLEFKGVLSIILILLLNFVVVFLPHMITADLWMAPRTMIGVFLFLTSIYLFILIFPLNRKLESLTMCLLVAFLAINMVQISKIEVNVIASNRIDREFVHIISNRIAEYETDSGNEITNIAVAKDSTPQYGYYDSIDFIRYDTNVRALFVGWAVVPAINYYSNRNYTKVEMPANVFDNYFKDKDWSVFNPDEQLVFIGDTLYFISY